MPITKLEAYTRNFVQESKLKNNRNERTEYHIAHR